MLPLAIFLNRPFESLRSSSSISDYVVCNCWVVKYVYLITKRLNPCFVIRSSIEFQCDSSSSAQWSERCCNKVSALFRISNHDDTTQLLHTKRFVIFHPRSPIFNSASLSSLATSIDLVEEIASTSIACTQTYCST